MITLFVPCVVIVSGLLFADGHGTSYNRNINHIVRTADPANPAIAFSAHRLHDTSLSKGQTIVFDAVETNLGQGYDKSHGRFTCPVDGVYFFTVNILSHINHLLQAYIVLDDTPVAGLYTVGASSGKDDQSTASAVIVCSAGQQVWVTSLDNYLLNGEAIGYTQFTGFRLRGDETHNNIAFSAHKTRDELLASGQALVFDVATTNIGHAYNNETGLFICPVNGIYFFTANVLSNAHHPLQAYVMLDNKPVAGLYAVGASSSTNDHSTASAAVHCIEGQRVSVTSQGQFSVNGEQVGYTQFTGFLLARDDDPYISDAVPFPTVAFSAHRHHDYTVPAGAALMFDLVETNLGMSYNENNGKFTCPLDGVYYFTVNILSHIHHPFLGYVMLQDRPIAGVYAIGANPSADDQSSVAVAVHCIIGQQVWVKSIRAQLINGESVGFTQFSGFLLVPDTPDSIVG